MESLNGEGYSAECVYDAIQGEELIRKGSHDIVLLDYKMPALSGVDILKKLKSDNIQKRIFIFSGRPSTEQALKEEDLSDMVSGVIPKPVDFKTLLEKIKS